ncbi:hypothetical protein ES319_D11G091300v1 [Gossypium barbadense]|uniref:K-box domain-containing protein n=1 Tax=Gossypium barbadense TaxID=3634 RepID=A0A5J5P8H6_GOSBA|nr:hypothetical protein ES319_D11G091300v1 [Gossypium barbadense]KAB2002828.1 hypothetical protein ES319_D11G091300v1 [Gossypium barbadense]
MVRGKTQMKRIENPTSRGKPYEFASSSMQETIERYLRHTKDNRVKPTEQSMQHLKTEAEKMLKKIELLEVSRRKLLGENLGSCALEELQQIEQQLERSVTRVRARKAKVFKDQIEKLKEKDLVTGPNEKEFLLQPMVTQKEEVLAAENAMLCEKYGMLPGKGSKEVNENEEANDESSPSSDVETELFIGLPEGRAKRIVQPNSTD